MGISNRGFKRRGYDTETIALAQATAEASRRAGAPRSVAEVLAQKPARARPSGALVDLTAQQLRRRGGYGQAALLLDQAALAEADPEKAERARFLAHQAKGLGRARQLEFDLIGGGNVSLGHQYIDAVQTRLMETSTSAAERDAALATLLLITRHLEWQGYACTKVAADLAEMRGVKKSAMAETLALLERVGAISRVKKGRSKIIAVTPEGAFRGSLNPENPAHAKAVASYSAEVVQLHQKPTA